MTRRPKSQISLGTCVHTDAEIAAILAKREGKRVSAETVRMTRLKAEKKIAAELKSFEEWLWRRGA